MTGPRARWPWGRWLVIGIPAVWLTLFFLLPFGIVLKISLSEAAVAIPPFQPWFGMEDRWLNATLANFRFLLTDNLYVAAYLSSLKIAAISTVVCLLLGFPLALGIARASPQWQAVLLLLVIVPSWTSFLIRVYAWMGILGNTGVINTLMLGLGLIDRPLVMLRTDFAVYVGIVYAYLPFMVLPLYATLVRIEPALLEAAADLGAGPATVFLRIVLPLAAGGILAGCMLVFVPALGEFVIPELLGGADTLMIGKVLWQEFFNNRAWPLASAVAVVLLALLLAPLWLFHHQQARSMGMGR
ncbi:MAG: ABC transporter permease subunit [Gammaproteobacteria bacterium]|nr:MAG: ABC transporter permease subunit [Gammaproteobacteria bacterium]